MNSLPQEPVTSAHNHRAISRLTLGTCQLGVPYGIANRRGQPSYREACDIIAAAYEGGVNCLDTAAAYGESEKVIGQALIDLRLTEKMTVMSKVLPIPADLPYGERKIFIENSVASSLKSLNLETLPICLFHREADRISLDILADMQSRGLVQRIGVSTYNPQPTMDVLQTDIAQVVEFPTNILDQRFVRHGVMEYAQKRNKMLFIRSIFLQGLLIMPPDEFLPYFDALKPLCRQLNDLAAQAGITIAEMAVRYALSLPGVTSLVIGIETMEQMRDTLRLISRGPLDDDLLNALYTVVPDLPDEFIMPMFWPNAW